MVDIVARVVVEDDDSRTLNFKSNEVIFGGGRLKGVTRTSIPLSWDALMEVYDEANQSNGQTRVKTSPIREEKPADNDSETAEAVDDTPAAQEEAPRTRTRKRRGGE